MGRFDGKVALITGAARGQGRGHAVRLAGEGADVIAVDVCQQLDVAGYPLATREDLAETVAQVEALDRRIVAVEADVRDLEALRAAVDEGAAELGGVDIVVANAGIGMSRPDLDQQASFQGVIEVNLFGVWNTVHAAVPRMIEQDRGGAIVLISSVMGLSGRGGSGSGGMDGYTASKHALVGLARGWANWLAPHRIRVNTVHPTGVNTPMINNDAMQEVLANVPAGGPDLTNLLDVSMVESSDVSGAVAWLASDEGRYVTGIALPVDAGFLVK